MIDFEAVLQLSVALLLVLVFLLFSADAKPQLLKALKYVRGFAWLFLVNMKLHNTFFRTEMMKGSMFVTGYVSILRTKPLFQGRIYFSTLAVLFGLLWCRRGLNDAKERLEIVSNAICTQIVFMLMSSDEIVIALQLGSFIGLFYLYAADHESNDPKVIWKSLCNDAIIGIGYGIMLAVGLGGILLIFIAGKTFGFGSPDNEYPLF